MPWARCYSGRKELTDTAGRNSSASRRFPRRLAAGGRGGAGGRRVAPYRKRPSLGPAVAKGPSRAAAAGPGVGRAGPWPRRGWASGSRPGAASCSSCSAPRSCWRWRTPSPTAWSTRRAAKVPQPLPGPGAVWGAAGCRRGAALGPQPPSGRPLRARPCLVWVRLGAWCSGLLRESETSVCSAEGCAVR